MIQTIRVASKNKIDDLSGKHLLNDIRTELKRTDITSVETVKIYRLEGVSEKEAELLTKKVFCEDINQIATINKPLLSSSSKIIEISYKPGVMNPEVASILKAAKDLGVNLIACDTSREYGFVGKINLEDAKKIIHDLKLFNKTVEHIVEDSPTTLIISGTAGKTKTITIREINDDQLMQLSKDTLFLNLEEMHVIQKYFQKIKRDPTDAELETLAQTWSEHSGHKTFKANITIIDKDLPSGRQKKTPLFSRIKKEALKHKKNIVSAFVDNSGAMDFYDGWAICGKAETHNSPSAIEPYGGAMTGSGGVFRDIVGTGLGAKTLVSTDIFCLAHPTLSDDKLPAGSLSPLYILKRVIAAVKDYGNRMGIPTNNGSLHFHNDFRAKPTVLVGAYGILPKKSAQKGTPKKGDIIVSIGGRIGRDGIHGATFSSAEMTDRTISVNAQAVQIGNAIEEKRTFDAIIEARDAGLIRAIQDSGGGGLSSAVGEIGSELGVTVQLKNERLKYQGLSPWEIWLSESQERMVLAIPKNKFSAFEKVCQKYNVEVTNLGFFDGSKKLNLFYGDEAVGELDMEFLHNGLPQRNMIAKKSIDKPLKEVLPTTPKSSAEWITICKKILSHPNIASKEPIVRLYDHTVQGTAVVYPFSGEKMDGPNDASVIRPLLNKPYGMVVSHGLNPILNRIDPYWGSMWAGAEALANYVAVGGDYKTASLINNYVWPFPDEESLWSLDQSVDAVVDFMSITKMPVISGKDSLSSTYRGKDGTIIKIPPVLCISVFGKIKDVSKTMTSDLKKENSILCLVGAMDYASLGGSTYYDIYGVLGNSVPKVAMKKLIQVADVIYNGIQKNQILSVHDISEGGLLTTVFEMCVGGNIGAHISISNKLSPEQILFNETAGTFVIEIENEHTAKKLFKNIPYTIIGKTLGEKILSVEQNKKELFSISIESLKRFWQEPMQKIFN